MSSLTRSLTTQPAERAFMTPANIQSDHWHLAPETPSPLLNQALPASHTRTHTHTQARSPLKSRRQDSTETFRRRDSESPIRVTASTSGSSHRRIPDRPHGSVTRASEHGEGGTGSSGATGRDMDPTGDPNQPTRAEQRDSNRPEACDPLSSPGSHSDASHTSKTLRTNRTRRLE